MANAEDELLSFMTESLTFYFDLDSIVKTQHNFQNLTLDWNNKDQQVEIVEMLLEQGADPMYLNSRGEDALLTSAIHNLSDIIECLISRVQYPPEKVADALELMGTHHQANVPKAMEYWRRAQDIRRLANGQFLEKKRRIPNLAKPQQLPLLSINETNEFRTDEELDIVTSDDYNLKLQCFLIRNRILGYDQFLSHSQLFKTMIEYRQLPEFQKYIDLMLYNVTVLLNENGLLSAVTYHGFEQICDIRTHFEDVNQLFWNKSFFDGIVNSAEILMAYLKMANEEPIVEKNDKLLYDKYLWMLIYHFLLLTETFRDDLDDDDYNVQGRKMLSLVHQAVSTGFRSFEGGNDLLHMVILSNSQNINNKFVRKHWRFFRDSMLAMVLLFLECGSDVNSVNDHRMSPLHMANDAHLTLVMEKLLLHGGHLDQRNKFGHMAGQLLVDTKKINELEYTTLQCLAARAIVDHRVPYEHIFPMSIQKFIQLH